MRLVEELGPEPRSSVSSLVYLSFWTRDSLSHIFGIVEICSYSKTDFQGVFKKASYVLNCKSSKISLMAQMMYQFKWTKY